ncbi:hypothetical protein Acor_56970 [Acrocarpospora corrugata]|uniref:Uncharacterized protein n=1 Tax=Acrocarpospora corrugata TaxID=35763 RepID=A0A5M3W9A2_9ACTN|nr:hypothetical protein Acor_56970 [Acrocarpospora corrugata]
MVTKTSPGRIVTAGISASTSGNATRNAMLFINVVAIDCATNRPRTSRIAADASDPSTMNVE